MLIQTLNCIVVTPDKVVLQTPVDFVALPLYDGEIGIAPGRAPLIGRLSYGEMRLTVRGVVSRYYLDGGIVEVADGSVSVLTNRLIPIPEIDVPAAQQQLREALQTVATSEEQEGVRDRRIAQARAMLHLAHRA
jgi:F-type H+-transporting ATPase subunit epsilon